MDAQGSNVIIAHRGNEIMRVMPRVNEDVNGFPPVFTVPLLLFDSAVSVLLLALFRRPFCSHPVFVFTSCRRLPPRSFPGDKPFLQLVDLRQGAIRPRWAFAPTATPPDGEEGRRHGSRELGRGSDHRCQGIFLFESTFSWADWKRERRLEKREARIEEGVGTQETDQREPPASETVSGSV